MSSRFMHGTSVMSATSLTLISFSICRTRFLMAPSEPGTTVVMRDSPTVSEGPTARLWMLYPRRLSTAVTRLSTPAELSTVTLRMCERTASGPSTASASGSRMGTAYTSPPGSPSESESLEAISAAADFGRARPAVCVSVAAAPFASRFCNDTACPIAALLLVSPSSCCAASRRSHPGRSRRSATRPVRTISSTPKRASACCAATVLPGSPVTSAVMAPSATSTTRPRKTSTSCMASVRVSSVTRTLMSTISRSTRGSGVRSSTTRTFTSLRSCLHSATIMRSLPLTTTVKSARSFESPTARDSML
mmetsp:Transcript_13326/g.41806  ORF Transcript_13326/g.41806 Transcript_13326/m.41806 type:complete len:306 (-) Transcript_13326:198-1115(-)